MNLTKLLRDNGYILIEGPVRNYKSLQLWLKPESEPEELYYMNIKHAFKSDVILTETENPFLSLKPAIKDVYGFNIGITLLETILKSLGIGAYELPSKIKSGKSVSISYDNIVTKEYDHGKIHEYLSSADFKYINPELLKNANRSNILIITGTVIANKLEVDIETDFPLEDVFIEHLNTMTDGKMEFSKISKYELKMVSYETTSFPIAVKVCRIKFEKCIFKKLILLSDTSNMF